MRDNVQREMNGHNSTNSCYSSIGVRVLFYSYLTQRLFLNGRFNVI